MSTDSAAFAATTACRVGTGESPAVLAVDRDALADVGASLLRTGALLEDSPAVRPPDTGASAAATRSALEALGEEVDRAGGDLWSLGRRLASFTDLVAEVDDRARAEIDRVRGDALW